MWLLNFLLFSLLGMRSKMIKAQNCQKYGLHKTVLFNPHLWMQTYCYFVILTYHPFKHVYLCCPPLRFMINLHLRGKSRNWSRNVVLSSTFCDSMPKILKYLLYDLRGKLISTWRSMTYKLRVFVRKKTCEQTKRMKDDFIL